MKNNFRKICAPCPWEFSFLSCWPIDRLRLPFHGAGHSTNEWKNHFPQFSSAPPSPKKVMMTNNKRGEPFQPSKKPTFLTFQMEFLTESHPTPFIAILSHSFIHLVATSFTRPTQRSSVCLCKNVQIFDECFSKSKRWHLKVRSWSLTAHFVDETILFSQISFIWSSANQITWKGHFS